jgi:regulator of cell morphogenesis and NO signaling
MTTKPTCSAPTADAIHGAQTLAELATKWAGASRVFHRYGFDFCCHGQVSVAAACQQKSVPLDQVLAELRAEATRAGRQPRWDAAPLPALIEHIVQHYHEGHRRELPRLLGMAQRVERVHGDKPSCPRGLATLLATVADELEQHMAKEEQILFPMLRAGQGAHARAPIAVMEGEHVGHGANLERLRALAHDYVPPADACGTWQALYLGLCELEAEVMAHIHLENHVLFPRALGAG